MWYGHIRDLSPTAEGCMGGRLPNVTLLHWAKQPRWCKAVMVWWMEEVGWEGSPPHIIAHTTRGAHGQVEHFFLSLPPWPCSWRDALCSQVRCRGRGRQAINPRCPGSFCEGDEGICKGYDGNVVGFQAVSLEIMQIVTSTIRVIYLPCVQCGGTLHRGVLHPGVPVMWYGHIRDLSPTAEGCMGGRLPNVTLLHWAKQPRWCKAVMLDVCCVFRVNPT